MKFPIHFAEFLLLVLWVAAARADISLKLKNKQYLPPPIQQLPINEDYYNAKDTSNTQPQPKFGRNNLENARHQFFEVHKYYGSDGHINFPNRNLQKISGQKIRIEHINAPADFSLDDPNLDVSYLSLITGNDRRNSRTNNKIPFPVPFPSNFQHTFPEKSISQHSTNPFVGPHYLPPTTQHSGHAEQPFLIIPEYPTAQLSSHTSDESKSFKSTDYSSQEQEATRTDYLPPTQQHGSLTASNHFSHRELLSGSPLQNYVPNAASQGHDYSSRDNFEQNISFRNSNHYSSEQRSSGKTEENILAKVLFKGPDYLPPQTNFKGPDYLPPVQGNSAEPQSKPFVSYEINHDYLPPKQLNYESNTAFKGPGYLPPQKVHNSAAFSVSQQQILPAGYDFEKPANAEQAIEELHRLPEESPILEKSSNAVHDASQQTESVLRSGISPTPTAQHDAQTRENSENAINLLHNQETETNIEAYKDSKHSLPNYHFQRTPNSDHSVNQLHSTHSPQQHIHSENDSPATKLTTGYNSQDPVNVEQARSQEHNQQNSLAISPVQQITVKQSNRNYHAGSYSYQIIAHDGNFQTQRDGEVKKLSELSLQPFKGPDYLPPSTETQTAKASDHLPPTTGSKTFKAAEYLPPTTVSQTHKTSRSKVFKGPDYLPPTASSYQFPTETPKEVTQQSSEIFKGPKYLPPPKNEPSYQSFQQPQFKGPDYLPPTPTTATQGLQPTIIYPLRSYMTDIKPHDRYGSVRSSPQYVLPSAKTTINDFPHIYQTLGSKFRYYAPTMSYANNAFDKPENKGQLSNKTPLSAESVQITKTPTAKIRTVKIHNTNAVKTLKVLESLDEAGVKTIKILGSADEPTMAAYRIVKVLSGSDEQKVQTVQIFNDHQDVTANENAAATLDQGNDSYLPPRGKRNPSKKDKKP